MPARRASSSSASGTCSSVPVSRVRRRFLQSLPAIGLWPAALANGVVPWPVVEARARGSTVYFNAWGGDEAINRYLAWASGTLLAAHGVRLVHVKVSDIAEAVTRVLAERAAGRLRNGTVDLLWINGENFARLRQAGLLYGPWTADVPNGALIDATGNPTTQVDFTLPTAGYELAWGTAHLTLYHDAHGSVAPVPRTPEALLDWARANPGRFTYPRPPDFLGTSFLKQVLLLLANDHSPFARAPGRDRSQLTSPLWEWLRAIRPHCWRAGRLFPASGGAQRELLGMGEVRWSMAFNPLEGARAVASREWPPDITAVTFSGGALANSHFLAIPFNVRSPDAAMVVANFLLSPEAQARKADLQHWGDPTVLDLRKLGAAEQRLFGRAAGNELAGARLMEPHPGWVGVLESGWVERHTA